MENALTFAKDLKNMKPAAVVKNATVCDQFVTIYNSVWGEGGEAACNRESLYFAQQIMASDALKKCTGPSIYYAFIDLAVKGLSLQPGTQAQCYLLPRNVFVGYDQNNQKVYETTCSLTISGYGELALRERAGQIAHADNPVIVYEGDRFEWGEENGRKYVSYGAKIPRGRKIVACFVKITRPNGTVDYSVMLPNDWQRLAAYSAKQNRDGKANALYASGVDGQIDPGFLVAKCVKHAFRAYPRIPIGKGSAFAADIPDEQLPSDPYGGVDAALAREGAEPSPAVPEREPEDFAPKPDLSGGVSYPQKDDDDDTF